MTFYLGFDGGGTKTECVVLGAAGSVLGQAVGGPANPLRVGYDAAFWSLLTASGLALGQAKIESPQVSAVCAGLSGAGRPGVADRATQFLKQSFPNALPHVTTDLEVALEAAAGPGPGVILIAGTGSSAFGRNLGGDTARAGGHGPWIGDDGSAYDVGRRAVAAVARTRDLGSPPEPLEENILRALNLDSWDALVERVAQNADEVFPRLFPVVVDAATADDPVACEILHAAAAALAELASTVIRRLGLEKTEFILAKSGGVFARRTALDARLDTLLAATFPRAHIGALSVSPAVGAARLAARMAGTHLGEAAHGVEG